jgi:hypothetical protein
VRTRTAICRYGSPGGAQPPDGLGDPVGLVRLGVRGPGHDLGPSGRPVRAHLLVQPARDRVSERRGCGDDVGAAALVHRDRERAQPGVAGGELDDVADVGAAPLVDGLVVVADHAQFHPRPGQQPDQPFLRGLTWYSSTIRCASVACTLAATSGLSNSATAQEMSCP